MPPIMHLCSLRKILACKFVHTLLWMNSRFFKKWISSELKRLIPYMMLISAVELFLTSKICFSFLLNLRTGVMRMSFSSACFINRWKWNDRSSWFKNICAGWGRSYVGHGIHPWHQAVIEDHSYRKTIFVFLKNSYVFLYKENDKLIFMNNQKTNNLL